MASRRPTKPLVVGGVQVGGSAPITVQSMTKTDTRDVDATVAQIRGLEEAGCDIVRSAVPDMEAAQAIPRIKAQINIPLIADIHFHYRLALECLAGGVDCLRLNPGNIRDPDQVKQVVTAAKERGTPIRIGVNFGSLPPVGGIGQTRGFSRHLDMVNRLPKQGQEDEGDYSLVDHMVATGPVGNRHPRVAGLRPDQDFDEGLRRADHSGSLPQTVEPRAIPISLGHH